MTGVDNDLAPQHVRPELLECVVHRHKLFLCSRVIHLSFDESPACIAYGHQLLVESLPQDCSHRVVDNMVIKRDNT